MVPLKARLLPDLYLHPVIPQFSGRFTSQMDFFMTAVAEHMAQNYTLRKVSPSPLMDSQRLAAVPGPVRSRPECAGAVSIR